MLPLLSIKATKIQVCDIDPSLEEVMKKFKFRKEKNVAALVCKYSFRVVYS